MSNSIIQSEVIDVIVDCLGVHKSEVTMDAKFAEDLGADSLDITELALRLESNFAISNPDEYNVDKIVTVQDLVNYVEKIIVDHEPSSRYKFLPNDIQKIKDKRKENRICQPDIKPLNTNSIEQN